MVTFLWRYGSKPEATKAGSFVGVGSNAYYKDAVAWAAENGITSGVDCTHFAPDRGCVRGQVETFMYRALKPLVFPVSKRKTAWRTRLQIFYLFRCSAIQ